MPEIIFIAAVADNNVIGKDDDIPWRISEDFQHFKALTMGHPCIMGDKTYESLPVKPLPGRENIILTFDRNYHPEGAVIMYSFEEALHYLNDREKVFICGGASVYKIGLEVADRLELTRVHQRPEGDTFFPEVNFKEWKLVKEEKHRGFTFQSYIRKLNKQD